MTRALSNPVRLATPMQGIDGRTVLAGDRAPLINDGRIGDFWIDQTAKKLYGPKTATGWPDRGLIRGAHGWYPLERTVSDGTRRVTEVYDWAGGEGAKPATGYKTAAGALTSTIGEAADIRGPEGPAMLIEALDERVDPVTYDTLTAVSEDDDDNEHVAVKRLFEPGGEAPIPAVADAEALAVPAAIRSLRFHDGRTYDRTDEELDRLRRFRSADRWTADGNSDSANGGWWAERLKTECFDADQWLNFGSSTDQTANFDRLAAEMAAAAADGRAVHLVFPHGVKARLEGDVTLAVPGLRITGNSALLESYTSSREIPVLRVPNPQDVSIAGLRFDGRRDMKPNTVPSAPNHRAILMDMTEESRHFWLMDCKIRGFLDHTVIQNPLYGVDPNKNMRGYHFHASRNVFVDNGDPWNEATGASGVCLMTFAGSSRAIFRDNYFENCVHPIKVDSTARSRRRLHETNPGLSVEDGDWTGFDHIITGNQFHLDNDLGIAVGGGNFIDIQGCERVLCTHNIMNSVASPKHLGINIFSTQDFAFTRDIVVAHNILNCANRAVTVYQSERVSVHRNIITQPSGVSEPAIYVWNSDGATVQVPEDEAYIDPRTIVKEVYIDDNILNVPSGQVIWLRNSGGSADPDKFVDVFARRNTIRMGNRSDPFQVGISAAGAMRRLTTSDNDIRGGSQGIACQTAARDIRIRRNDIGDCNSGIVVPSGATGRVDFNDCGGCDTPFNLTSTGIVQRFNDGAVSTSGTILDGFLSMEKGQLIFGRVTADNYLSAIRFGHTTYIWPDATGKLRIKVGSAPSSNTDGDLVGEQTA